jgi:hypothetical protein
MIRFVLLALMRPSGTFSRFAGEEVMLRLIIEHMFVFVKVLLGYVGGYRAPHFAFEPRVRRRLTPGPSRPVRYQEESAQGFDALHWCDLERQWICPSSRKRAPSSHEWEEEAKGGRPKFEQVLRTRWPLRFRKETTF